MFTIQPIETCQERLIKAMAIRDMRATDLVEATGIAKGAISHYIHGINKPKQDRIMLLAEALRVRPEWLMGFDVPMEIDDFELEQQKRDRKIARYANQLASLNDDDLEFILRQIDVLRKAHNESY